MFARASKQRLQSDTYKQWQSSSEALHLPWLCPVLCNVAPHPRKIATIPRTGSTKKLSLTQPSLFQSTAPDRRLKLRGLASAAEAVQSTPQDDFIPFETMQEYHQKPQTPRHSWLNPNHFPSIPDFPPESVLMINENHTTHIPRFRSVNGISGDLKDITQTMLACLQVGYLDRAASLMRRLNLIYKWHAPELLAAHNEYLRGVLQTFEQTKDPGKLKGIHQWFEKDIRKVGVIPDASTYALMILATFSDMTVKDINRNIKRYISLAKEAGIWEDTRSIVRIISDGKEYQNVTQTPLDHVDKIDQGQNQDPTETVPIPEPIDSLVDNASDLPAVKATELKGFGLVSLRQALSMFSESSSLPLSKDDGATEGEGRKEHLFQRQQRLERDAYDSAVNRWRLEHEKMKSFGINTAIGQRSVGAALWTWHEKLVPLIEEEIRQVQEAESKRIRSPRTVLEKDRCQYGPFIRLLPAQKLSAIVIMSSIFSLTQKRTDRNSVRGIPLSKLVLQCGQAIEDEIAAEKIKNGSESSGPALAHRFRRLSHLIKNRNSQKSIAKLLASSGLLREDREQLKWSEPIRTRVGAVLISALIKVANIDVHLTHPQTGAEHRESQPALVHGFQISKGNRVGILRLNKAFFAILSKEPVAAALPRFLPMIVEPRPWTGFTSGAFLEYSRRAVRVRNDLESTRYAATASRNGDMKQIFAGLDILGKTPWRINRGLLEVMLQAWQSGEAFGKIPAEHPEFVYPPEPDIAAGIGFRRKWLEDLKAIENKKTGVKSVRCFYNFQLEIARAFANETLYFPHSVDFRGRAYPMVPLFNHMMADPCRSLLMFAKGKELGEGGLRWMKIHLASLYGFDKASFEDRCKFTDDHISDILDSATNALGGKRWWLQAEDPWQCLGACMEMKKALDEPDPRRFVSNLPIHQDGTCNGLQHYAALGGDVAGAKQVNLEPASCPSDVYTGVAEIVKAEIAMLAAQGEELAKLLDGKVTRKVVKQTVMTNVYGVTFMGAKRQVQSRLEDILLDFPNTFTLNLSRAALLITKLTFKALGSMFHGAQKIQHWFGACAGTISQAVSPQQIKRLQDQADGAVENPSKYINGGALKPKPWTEADLYRTSIIWTTPLKMPVVQPYRATKSQKVQTHLQNLTLARSSSSSDPVSKPQQRRAFPPNFIHSLDATHMMLTCLKCNEVGLSFAAVHDSFWTHPCDVDTMNRIIRDAFIRMHSEDILGRLRAEFSARYKGYMHLASIDRSSAVGQRILKWRKSLPRTPRNEKRIVNSKLRELLLENRRLNLLASEKPEERLEGESLITAGQIFQDMANDEDLAHAEDYSHLGEIPGSRDVSKIRHTDSAEESLQNKEDDGGEIEMHEEIDCNSGNNTDKICEEDHTNDSGEKGEEIARKSKKKPRQYVWLWLPVTFPPIPEKGEFDVSKLRDSQYFFS